MVASADNVDAGNIKSEACAACHGSTGTSTTDNIPSLAGQNKTYIVNQLKAFRDGKRTNPLMNAMAAGLTDEDMSDLAAFFNAQTLGKKSEPSVASQAVNNQDMTFPANYKQDFVYYKTVNRPDNKQVRDLYANKVAVESYKQSGKLAADSMIVMEVYRAVLDDAGNPVTGPDGYYKKNALAAYAVMESQAGFGPTIPERLRNADWNYAFFTADKQHNANVDKAGCYACHQPLNDKEHMFSFDTFKQKFTD
jgi:hemoglobin